MSTLDLKVIISAIDKTAGVMSGVGKNMQEMGQKMTMGVTLPLAGVGLAAGKLAMDFGDATRYMNTMMGATDEELKGMKKTTIDLAGHTGKSATDIMRSYYGIASAGYRGAEANKILAVATEGATAGYIEQGKSVDALVKVMSIYGKQGDEARETMDVMFGIVDKGLLTFDDLSTTFARASAFAVPLGLNMKEVGGAMGFLSKKTATAEEAATGMQGLTRAFIKPTTAMRDLTAEWAEKQGLAADTTAVQMVKTLGLKGTMDLLKEATGGNVEMMGKLIPESSGLTAALYLTSEEGAKELAGNLDYLNNVSGRTAEAFDEASESAKVKFAKALEGAKGSAIILGGVLLEMAIPVMEKLADVVEKVGNWYNGLNESQKRNVVIIAGIVAAIGPLLIVFGFIAGAITKIIVAIKALKGVFIVIKGVFVLATAKIWIIAGAIAALVAGVLYLRRNWETVWGVIADIVRIMVDKAMGPIRSMREGLEGIVSSAKRATEWVGRQKEAAGERVRGLVGRILPGRQMGGLITQTAPYLLHKGEYVTPAHRSGAGAISITITGNTFFGERQAVEELGNMILRRLKGQMRF